MTESPSAVARQRPDDFDTPWKEALTRYLPEFMAFYFPDAHAAIDWRQPYRFLDRELAQVVRDAELGKRIADRLVEVATLSGRWQWVSVHIEVQGQDEADFAERLFVYNYRLYDRHRRPVATLAVLADTGPAGARRDLATHCSAVGTSWSFRRPSCWITPRIWRRCWRTPTLSRW